MSTTPARILELVQHFETRRDSYHRGKSKEAQLREEFLNPVFEALGWHMMQQRIEVADRQIDWLVYELYELTEAEIGVVEGRG